MYPNERDSFFESLLTAIKWKYSEAEQLIIFEKLPPHTNGNELSIELIKEFSTKKPTGKKLINFAWNLVKKHKIEVKQQTFDGCHNCIDGYIKVPNLKSYIRESEEDKMLPIPTNIINLIHMTLFPSREIYCTCTKEKNNISKYLKELMNIQYSMPDLYEFVYVSLYAYAQMWLSEKRFKDFDSFNPYDVWQTLYEQGAVLKKEDCKHYGYVIDQEISVVTKPRIKTIPPAVEYNKKLYEK